MDPMTLHYGALRRTAASWVSGPTPHDADSGQGAGRERAG